MLTPAARVGATRRVPLTEEQLGLLVQHHADPEFSPYNIPLALDLRGPLDLGAVEAALAAVTERHPPLSGRVVDDGGLPELALRPGLAPVLERRTVAHTGEAGADAATLLSDARRELDLERDGVLRAVLYRHAPEHHTLLLVAHHLVVDGESTAILLADLLAAYQHGHVPGEDPVEFAEYVTARAERAGKDSAALEAYWRARLDGANVTVDFPLDTPGHDAATAETPGPVRGCVPVELDAELSAELGSLARRRIGSTALLLAAYLKALATYSRQPAPTVGVPLGVRDDLRFERTVGYFVRTLLVRAPDAAGLTAAEYAAGVQTELARAVDHAKLPFPRIARLLDGAGPPDPQPFNCTFVMHSWADQSAAAAEGVALPGGLRARWRQDVPSPGLGLLTLELYEGQGRIRGHLKYDATRIEAATAEAFTEHVLTLAAQLVREPETPVAELDGIGPRARAAIDLLNATEHPLPDTDIDTLLRERVATQPDRVALECGDLRWTYRELDERIDALAAGLTGQGVRAGDRVGVMLPRTQDAVAAILAIIRSGAAYVPLEPSHPEARRRHIVENSGMKAVLVADNTGASAPPGPELIRLDQLVAGPILGTAATPPTLLPGAPTGDSALHIFYTSGSTGVPKGVQLSHRALVTDVLAAIRHFGIGPDDAMLLKAPFTFDVSAHEMLVALVAGARLVVAPLDAEHDPDLLAESLERHGVTLLHAVPSQLRLLLETERFPANRTLRTVVSTGESLPNELRVAFEAAHPARLHNAYGPTEAAAYSTVFSWPRGEAASWTRRAEVPIGVPLDNIRCYVLNDDQRLLPPGAPGELWIGGGTVSDGYVGDPDRTAERYRRLDLGDGYRGRTYRTGDLVRLLPDGSLTHLGCLDDQVKVNGNRVELGDVRAALMSLDQVQDATVQVTRHARGSLQLVAYVAPHTLDPTAVRRAAGRVLPAHMVPVRVTPVARIPLLPNGKTDRQALARIVEQDLKAAAETGQLRPEQSEATRPRQAPTQPSQRPRPTQPAAPAALPVLRSVWTDLLGPSSDHAQFFESGGDSILAMQLVSRLRRAGYPLAVRDIHRHPVLTALAEHLDETAPRASIPAAGGADPAEHRGEPGSADSPLSPVQSWFFRHIRTDPHQWNQSVLLERNGPLDPAALRLALQAVVAVHPALSARFEGTADGHGRMVAAAPFQAYPPREVLWEREVDGDEELDEALEALQRSLAPLEGVHVRALLVHDRGADRDLLLLAVHHLVVDGVSWRVLLEDLEHALDALADGALPRLPVEACRYSEWIAGLPAVADRPGEAGYWRAVAAARAAAGTLLLTMPASNEEHTRRVEFALDAESSRHLIGPLPARVGLQVHELMTGAFAQALARWRGTSTVTFDVETHGRHGREDLFRTVGWFTAIHPVVMTVDRALHPKRYVAEARDVLTGVPDGGVGFGACREYASDAGLRETLRELPPALVCFNYYGQADQLSPSGRFRMSSRPIPREHSARCERVYGIEVYGIVHDGRLRMGLTWVPSPADGLTEAAVDALVSQLRWVVTTLAGVDAATVVAAEITSLDRAGSTGSVPERGTGGRETVPVTPQQQGLLLDALARSGTGRYVEQLFWRWHGPLDTDRFTAAWRSVVQREVVLRAAFDWRDEPRLVLHDHVPVEVVRLSHDATDWDDLLERDRFRGFDLARPGLLRVTLLDDPGQPGTDGSTRVLLTFHHVLLDGWSVSLLIQEFYRAYLADAGPSGIERRPDIRDYSSWLRAQDVAGARDYWASALPAGALAVLPALPGEATGQNGFGRAMARLTPAEADRLRGWAARRAATESSAVYTAWALLLSRASGAAESVPVSFGVTVSGRGIPLDGVERIPGLLMNSLPMMLQIDLAETIPGVLVAARDRVLDMASYEWVSAGQIHEWSGRGAGEPLAESLVVFENYPRSPDGLAAELAAHGIRVELPDAAGSQTAFPVILLVYRDESDSLVLVVVHDRARLADDEAAKLVERCAWLLRDLPHSAGNPGTVAELLATLPDEAMPRMAERPTGAAATTSGDHRWPAGSTAELVRDAWQATLGCASVAPGDHFFEAGGHSLLAMKLLRELTTRTGRQIRLDDLLRHPTAGRLAHLIEGGVTDLDEHSVLVPLREPASREAGTLYLIHPPGGQVACYAQLAQCFTGPEAIIGIRDPRVDDPEPRYLSVEQLSDVYLEALRPALDSGGRIVLGGFSGGGVIAYEVARRIAAEGNQPPLVVLVDAGAPDGELTDPEADGSFANQLRALIDGRASETTRDDDRTEDAGAAGAAGAGEPADAGAYLAELAQIADWMRGGADPVILMRDSVDAIQRYRPGASRGPVVVLRAGDTGFGKGTEYDESDRFYSRPGLGWEDHCDDLSIRVVPGNHVTMLTGDNVGLLSRVLASVVRADEQSDQRT